MATQHNPSTVGGSQAPETPWRNKIILAAVECEVEGVQLTEPPFPFSQHWDEEAERLRGRGQKRSRDEFEAGADEEDEGTDEEDQEPGNNKEPDKACNEEEEFSASLTGYALTIYVDYGVSVDEWEDEEDEEDEDDKGYRREEPYDWREEYPEEQVDDDDYDWGEEYPGDEFDEYYDY